MTISIEAGHHWLVIGETGSGKTFWAMNWFLPHFSRQIVLDTEEMEFDDKIWNPVSIPTAVRLASRDRPFRVRVPMDVGETGQEQYGQLSDGILEKGKNVVIWVDEYPDFTLNSRQTPEGLRLTRKARKRGVTLAFATQRPQSIDKDAYTQTRHHVWFGMDPGDVDYWHTRAPYLVPLMPSIPIGSFQWIYHHSRDAPEGQVFAPVEKHRWQK